MKPRRFATVAAVLCGTIVLAGGVVTRLAGFATASIENSGELPIEDRRAPSLIVGAELAAPPLTTGRCRLARFIAAARTTARAGGDSEHA